MTEPRKGKKKVIAKGGEVGETTGGYRPCTMVGCRGVRVVVRWPDRKYTYPCTEGMSEIDNGWEIK